MTFSSKRLPLDIKPTVTSNRLYYGDNLTIMKEYIPRQSVDLVYLDPPFNSQRNYNLIYKQLTGQPVPEQEEAFCDAWEMDSEKLDMMHRMPVVYEQYGVDPDLAKFWDAWIKALRNTQPRLLAYLLYMTIRLFEMRLLLSSRGSIYLHCDPHASHYMKVIMDGVFGHENFRNEIIWKRTNAKGLAFTRLASNHDVILRYSMSNSFTWNPQYRAHNNDYIKKFYRFTEPDTGRRYRLADLTNPNKDRPNLTYEFLGVTRVWRWTKERMQAAYEKGLVVQSKPGGVPVLKRYLDEQEGTPIDDVWTDILPVQPQAKERLGYPTQKPIELLKRIIAASTNKDDVVFDPFCGCGTAIYAAHMLNRKWIGCDIAILSIDLVRDVLLKRYGLQEDKDYIVDGIPRSVGAAQELFAKDPRQFQHWAVELAGGFVSAKYSGDRGIDGRIHFETKDGLRNMVVSVKGGKLAPTYVRDLSGVVQREEDTRMGGLICLENPTKGMLQEVADGGIYTYEGKNYARLQIRTIQDLLDCKWFDTPSTVRTLGKSSQTIMPM
jgi:DNA modification methylase